MKRKGIIFVVVVVFCTLAASLTWAASTYDFGKKWSYRYCAKKGCGKVFLHAGKDYSAPVGKDVYFHRSGTIKDIHLDSSGWRYCAVIDSNWTTFTVFHIEPSSKLKSFLGKYYDVGKNGPLHLGKVSNLSSKGSPSHVHVAQRSAQSPRYSAISYAGALPQCDHKSSNSGLPRFPEHFKSPDSGLINFK